MQPAMHIYSFSEQVHNSENAVSMKALTHRLHFYYFTSFFANSQYFHLIFIYFHSKLTSCDTCIIAGCYDSAYTVFSYDYMQRAHTPVRRNRLMTIYDVSEKAGVSIATVSRVLNGSDNVSAQTRQKVLAVIEACDYTPNAFARGLGLNSMNTIGILCADSSDLYLANAVYHVEQELRANNYNCILCCTGYELSDKQKYLNLLVNKKVDSVILVGSHFVSGQDSDNDYIREAAKEIPVLLLNADFDCENVYCGMCDDFKATMQATTYLLETGVEDILYLYNSKSYSALRKLSGYQSALTQKGIPLRMEYMPYFPGRNYNLLAIADFLAELDRSIHYQGIIASNDYLAIGAAKFAHKKGLDIPKDLSIIGYNNSILSTCCDPELTSVDNRLETLCQIGRAHV